MREQEGKNIVIIQPMTYKGNTLSLFASFAASLLSMVPGYYMVAISASAILLHDKHKVDGKVIEIFADKFNIYSLIGIMGAAFLCEFVGRLYTLLGTAGILTFGPCMMAFAKDFHLFENGGVVCGIASGFSLMIGQIYSTEIHPIPTNGMLMASTEVSINGGNLIGCLIESFVSKMSNEVRLRVLLGFPAIPAVLLLAVSFILPESAVWLMSQGYVNEAQEVLDKTSHSIEAAQHRGKELKRAFGIALDLDGDFNAGLPTFFPVFRKLFCNSSERNITLCGVLLSFFMQASGVDVMVMYAPILFRKMKWKTLHVTLSIIGTKTVSLLLGTFMLRKTQRRCMLLSSMSIMVISEIGFSCLLEVIDGSSSAVEWAIKLCIPVVLFTVFFHSYGMAPLLWVYGPEMLQPKLRTGGMCIFVLVNRGGSSLGSVAFLSLHGDKLITRGQVFLVFSLILLLGLVIFSIILPEVKGRSQKQIEEVFSDLFKSKIVTLCKLLESGLFLIGPLFRSRTTSSSLIVAGDQMC